MINHVRTLIVNAAKSYEFVPPQFIAVPETALTKKVRYWLFYGLTASECNGRIQQLMQVLHLPEYESYTLKEDSRVTYLPFIEVRGPGSLVDVIRHLHAALTDSDEAQLFHALPEFRTLWESDKALDDIAGCLLALATRTAEIII